MFFDCVPDGPSKGQRLSKETLSDMLDNYYDLRGWDRVTGNPTEAKLKDLDLDFAVVT